MRRSVLPWSPYRAAIHRLVAGAIIAIASLHGMANAESLAGPRGPEQGTFRRQFWLIPSTEQNVPMRTTVFRPPGPGPFPLMVMNHGSTQNEDRRKDMPTAAFQSLAQWFVKRGYAVVVPQRPGHGETGGPYLEDQGRCEDADFKRAGYGTAASIAAAIAYMTDQPFIRRNGVIVVGQSAGAWGALALASRNPAGVRGVINFAGGRGGHSYDRPDNNCVPERLVAGARDFGGTSRIPTLWIYTENDSYFSPRLSKAMADGYRAAGGLVDYQLLPSFGADGHLMAESEESEPIWGPILEQFLARLR